MLLTALCVIRCGCTTVLVVTFTQWVGLEGRAAGTRRHHEAQGESVTCQSSKISVKAETLKEQRKARKSVEIV